MSAEEATETRMADLSLHGRVALVTGGGSGLGRAICTMLTRGGASVVVADTRQELADETRDQLCALSGHTSAIALPLDAGDGQQVEATMRMVCDTYGGIDILINSASTATATAGESAAAEWERVVNSSLRGPFLLSRQAFAEMKGRDGGYIVNIVWAPPDQTGSASYASAWGLLGLSHGMHAEGRAHGVAVTAVIAGGVHGAFARGNSPGPGESLLPDAEDVAETIRLVLLQPAAAAVAEVTVRPSGEAS